MGKHKKKLFDKKRDATFSLVHRSQRDPLAADSDAPQRILLPTNEAAERMQAAVLAPPTHERHEFEGVDEEAMWEDADGDEFADAEDESVDDEQRVKLAKEMFSEEVESVDPKMRRRQLGIFYDDDYDYEKHLSPIGRDANATFIAAPSKRGGAVSHTDAELPRGLDTGVAKVVAALPTDVFASTEQQDLGALYRAAAPVTGPQLDVDPDILAALDSDYEEGDVEPGVFGDLDDDFVVMANDDEYEDEEYEEGGEYSDEEEGGAKRGGVHEWLATGGGSADASVDVGEAVRARLRAVHFDTHEHTHGGPCVDGGDDDDNDDDRFAAEETRSRFTDYSLSSSIMPRSEALQTLDDRFERLMEEYDDEKIGALDDDEEAVRGCIDDEEEQMEGNEALSGVFDAYLEKQEMTRADELAAFGRVRTELRDTVRLPTAVASDDEDDTPEADERRALEVREMFDAGGAQKEQWDCESILSTYSNLYHHPKVIEDQDMARRRKARQAERERRMAEAHAKGTGSAHKIELGAKGMPVGVIEAHREQTRASTRKGDEGKGADAEAEEGTDDRDNDADDGDDDDEDDADFVVGASFAPRPKGESAEEKRARKHAIKEERRLKRAVKKETRSAFASERRQQEACAIARKANLGALIL